MKTTLLITEALVGVTLIVGAGKFSEMDGERRAQIQKMPVIVPKWLDLYQHSTPRHYVVIGWFILLAVLPFTIWIFKD
jgi:hypothetical protein